MSDIKAVYIGDDLFFIPWGRYLGLYWRTKSGGIRRKSNSALAARYTLYPSRHSGNGVASRDLRKQASNNIARETFPRDIPPQEFKRAVFYHTHDKIFEHVPQDAQDVMRKCNQQYTLDVLLSCNAAGDEYQELFHINPVASLRLLGFGTRKRSIVGKTKRLLKKKFDGEIEEMFYYTTVGYAARAAPYIGYHVASMLCAVDVAMEQRKVDVARFAAQVARDSVQLKSWREKVWYTRYYIKSRLLNRAQRTHEGREATIELTLDEIQAGVLASDLAEYREFEDGFAGRS